MYFCCECFSLVWASWPLHEQGHAHVRTGHVFHFGHGFGCGEHVFIMDHTQDNVSASASKVILMVDVF
jgi:hypothetical protein